MDPRPETAAGDPVIVTGLGHALPALAPCDPTPSLKVPKLRKFMGAQDDLAVVAAARALASANLRAGGRAIDPQRVGLYLVVGYIPFEEDDIAPLAAASIDAGAFSMQRFASDGFRAVNGLLTFRCLPNMPAFHVSVNFDIQGPYFVTYPGPGQLYLALEAACTALAEEAVDVALVGGVAHQQNFLVRHHYSRLDPPGADELQDAAGCLVLERRSSAEARGAACRARLLDLDIAYRRHHPFEASITPHEALEGASTCLGGLGAASLPAWLSQEAERGGRRRHVLRSRDGFVCTSAWELP